MAAYWHRSPACAKIGLSYGRSPCDCSSHTTMVQVTVQLPDEIAQQFGRVPEEMPSRILEAIALEGYHSGKLSCGQVSQLLHLDPQQTDQWLAERQAIRPNGQKTELPQRDLDLEAFERFLPQLLESNRGHFVAIADGKVVDRDPDELRLVERICRERPGQRVLVQKVLDRILDEVHMDTPEAELPKEQAG